MNNIMDFWRSEWDAVADTSEVTGMDFFNNGIIPVTDANAKNISIISWGETRGIYPTKNTLNPPDSELYNPSKWDEEKTASLLKARAAIHLIGTSRNAHVHQASCELKGINKTLAAYHLIDNFPEVDPVVANDGTVKFFYLSSLEKVDTPSIDSQTYNQKCVKSYGPFYNNGGGDVPRGEIYIHFFKAILKR